MSRAISHIDTFQGLILALQNYWAEQGCVVLQPYDMEMGAGTFHTATLMLRCGMFQRPFPCRKVVIRRSLVRPNSFVGQELSPEMYQYAI